MIEDGTGTASGQARNLAGSLAGTQTGKGAVATATDRLPREPDEGTTGNQTSRRATRATRATSRPSDDEQPSWRSHALELDIDDITHDLDRPARQAGLAAKASLIVRTGILDLAAGTGSYRIREMMNKIADPLGIHVHAKVNLTDLEATCQDRNQRLTEIVDLPTTGVNTNKIWAIEHFSEWFEAHPESTVRQAHQRLAAIESQKPLYPIWFSAFASAVACGAFVFLLGGGLIDITGAFLGAGFGHYLRRFLFKFHLNQFIVTMLAVALAALVCLGSLRVIGLWSPSALSHDTAYIGAMLFVIPGFPLVTGGLDIAKLDFPSGIQRLAYALSIIGVATLAAWAVANAVHLDPHGFEAVHLAPALLLLLRLVASFLGVWGFSVLFNSPQKMAVLAAIIGALADTTRLELQDLGSTPELAAFTGALIAGLLASAWRISVRRGHLPARFGFPRITLTVPAIVIMVPGLYMYRAVFYLGQFSTLNAIDWGFRALMVIVCLPIGLAVARVLTDPKWRYDI